MRPASLCQRRKSIWTNTGTNSKRFYQRPAKILNQCQPHTTISLHRKSTNTILLTAWHHQSNSNRPPPNWICCQLFAIKRQTICMTNWIHLYRRTTMTTTIFWPWKISTNPDHRISHSAARICTMALIWIRPSLRWARTRRSDVHASLNPIHSSSHHQLSDDDQHLHRFYPPLRSQPLPHKPWVQAQRQLSRHTTSIIATFAWALKTARTWRTKRFRYIANSVIMTPASNWASICPIILLVYVDFRFLKFFSIFE